MLNPACLRINLLKFILCFAYDVALFVKIIALELVVPWSRARMYFAISSTLSLFYSEIFYCVVI